MFVKVFSSGSCGNATLIRANQASILVDAGITQKSINENLAQSGLTINDITCIFFTHEHDDHIRAIPTLLKYVDICLYMTQGTLDGLIDKLLKSSKEKCVQKIRERIADGTIKIIKKLDNSLYYESFVIGDINVDIIQTFHDANEPVGFIFKEDDKKLVYVTDTGYVHQSFFNDLQNADCYILESNHDPEILMCSQRPYYTKMRILSDHGHLSNEDSMILLAKLIGEKTKYVLHAHVSQECNLSQIIEMTRQNVFNEYGIASDDIQFEILSPRPSKEYNI